MYAIWRFVLMELFGERYYFIRLNNEFLWDSNIRVFNIIVSNTKQMIKIGVKNSGWDLFIKRFKFVLKRFNKIELMLQNFIY